MESSTIEFVVVCDTSALIPIIATGRFPLLMTNSHGSLRKIVIGHQVQLELQKFWNSHKELETSHLAWLHESSLVEVLPEINSASPFGKAFEYLVDFRFAHSLPNTPHDLGEHEAIAIAVELSGNYESVSVLIDDAAGRRLAERQGMDVIGSVRMLLEAIDTGLINNFADFTEVLGEFRRYGRYSDRLLADVTRQASEAFQRRMSS